MRKIHNQPEERDQANGRMNGRNLFWSWYRPKNFGDWVTPYLFEKLTGTEAIHCPVNHLMPGASTVFGCGSILRHIRVSDVAIVWGSGIIDSADVFARPLKTLSVRGPRTRARMLALGHDCPDIYGDPALILPKVYRSSPPKAFAIGLVPHFVELPFFRNARLPEGWKLIDVTQDLEAVVNDITRCERTVSSSLHGIIVSHAYGVPCAWVHAGRALDGDGVKFRDYFDSVGIPGSCEPGTWNKVAAKQLDALEFHLPDVRDIHDIQKTIVQSCPFHALAEV